MCVSLSVLNTCTVRSVILDNKIVQCKRHPCNERFKAMLPSCQLEYCLHVVQYGNCLGVTFDFLTILLRF